MSTQAIWGRVEDRTAPDAFIRLMNERMARLTAVLNAKQDDLAWVDVRRFGATGNGIADDTAAIERAIASLGTSGVLYYPPGTYKVTGAPTLSGTSGVTVLGYGATLQLSGTGAYGLKFAGINDRLRVYGLRVIGSGVTADDHQGLGNAPTPGVGVGGTGLVIRDVTVEDCTRGIILDVGTTFDWADVLIEGCTVLRTNGTSSGQGYGIVLSGVFGGRVRDCYVERSTRHGIYISAGDKHIVSGCVVYQHRFGIGTGGLFAAIEIARCNDVTASDNLMIECTDGGMDVLPDESATRSVRNIIVRGNTFVDSVNNDLHVGNQGPSTSGSFRDVLVEGNTFVRPSGATNAGYAIRVFHGIGVTIRGNHFDGDRSFTITTAAIYLSAAEGATYTDRIVVEDNTCRYTASGGGFVAFVEIATSLAGASQSIRVVGNAPTLSGGAGNALILYDDAPTTTTLECWGNSVDDSGSTAVGPVFRAHGSMAVRGDAQIGKTSGTYLQAQTTGGGGNAAVLAMAIEGTYKAFVAAAAAANDTVTGTAAGDMALRTQGGALLVSTDSGGTAHLNLSGTALTAKVHLKWGTDNTFDIGATGANRPRDCFLAGDLKLQTAGKGLYVKEGTNATMGTAVLVAGTVTVNTTKVTADSRIFLTSQVDGGTPGFLRVTARVAGTSFTITSSNAADTSTVAWLLMEPA